MNAYIQKDIFRRLFSWDQSLITLVAYTNIMITTQIRHSFS